MYENPNILISVVVPCFNQAAYLEEALESVIDQTFLKWECIIVNDGSTDQTQFIIDKWVKKDERFIHFYQENSGLSSARNLGISKAKGFYILPLDADDKISNDYLDLAFNQFENNPNLKVVYSKAEKFGSENGAWNLRPFSLFNLALGNVIYCSGFFKKADWERIGGYDEDMHFGFEDWEFWIRLLKNEEGEVLCIDKVCFYYRVKESSMLKAIDSHKKQDLIQYITIKHPDFFVKQFGTYHSYMQNGLKENADLKRLLRSRKHAIKTLLRGLFY
ncbi:glycosyltransferase involved in cell wall biosynthesis [Flavobacteriaceae bacterium MAR_2010_105]|nr:glycosyltransferase involved in cell wall biosynthesis [Flavobacteriaceae bacterium MAR_2010_105]